MERPGPLQICEADVDPTRDITVRRHERGQVDLRGELVIAMKHRDQVNASSAARLPAEGVVPVRIADISTGGLGWTSGFFVPRRCLGEIRVLVGPVEDEEVVFTHPVEVRRVRMLDGGPTYSVGAAFADANEATTAYINELIACYIRPNSDATGSQVS